jgi:hypothetical protein
MPHTLQRNDPTFSSGRSNTSSTTCSTQQVMVIWPTADGHLRSCCTDFRSDNHALLGRAMHTSVVTLVRVGLTLGMVRTAAPPLSTRSMPGLAGGAAAGADSAYSL